MNPKLEKEVQLIRRHHNYLFTQPLPRELRRTTMQSNSLEVEEHSVISSKSLVISSLVIVLILILTFL